MGITVELNHERTLDGNKVNDVWTDRRLPSELHTLKPTITQSRPENSLGHC